jgi:hypothetical protein
LTSSYYYRCKRKISNFRIIHHKFQYVIYTSSSSKSIGKEVAFITVRRFTTVGRGEALKNFDQWVEELSKQIFIQNDKEDMKIVWKMNEAFDDDLEEEE